MDIRSDPNGPELDEVLRLAKRATTCSSRTTPCGPTARSAGPLAAPTGKAVAAMETPSSSTPRPQPAARAGEHPGARRPPPGRAEHDRGDGPRGQGPFWVYLNRGRARHGAQGRRGRCAGVQRRPHRRRRQRRRRRADRQVDGLHRRQGRGPEPGARLCRQGRALEAAGRGAVLRAGQGAGQDGGLGAGRADARRGAGALRRAVADARRRPCASPGRCTSWPSPRSTTRPARRSWSC